MKINKALLVSIFSLFLAFFLKHPQSISAQNVNPVIWKTAHAKFSSSNFYIRINDRYFYGTENVRVHSDPGTNYSTLELSWDEDNAPMRLYFYFKKTSQNEWELYDLRSYNGSVRGDWIYYSPKDNLGNKISSLAGMHNYADKRVFLPLSNTSAEIHCDECSISAFLDIPLKYSSHGYALQVMSGIETNKTITVSTNPMTGYGVNVLLKDQSGQVVTDQGNMNYVWRARNNNIIEITTQNLEYADGNCAYGVKAPCPDVNGQLRGISPGITTIDVNVVRDGVTIASNEFDVKVVEHVPTAIVSPMQASPSSPVSQVYEPAVTPVVVSTSSNNEYQQLQEELEVLKGTVGEIQLDVDRQQKDLNMLQRLVRSITSWFERIPWFSRR